MTSENPVAPATRGRAKVFFQVANAVLAIAATAVAFLYVQANHDLEVQKALGAVTQAKLNAARMELEKQAARAAGLQQASSVAIDLEGQKASAAALQTESIAAKSDLAQEAALAAELKRNPRGAIYVERLNKILTEYRALPDTPDIKRLFEMDQELSALVKEMQATDKDGTSAKYWRKDYEDIGLYIGHYSEMIGYSGKLLVEAHERNPNSPYRKYTLFTTILGEGTSYGLGEMPDISQAELYLKEFPNGPHAAEVYKILGTFYDDLAKVLKKLIDNDESKDDFVYECFKPYITKEPHQKQMGRAVSLAVTNLEKAIAINPSTGKDWYTRKELDALKSGELDTHAYSWCAD